MCLSCPSYCLFAFYVVNTLLIKLHNFEWYVDHFEWSFFFLYALLILVCYFAGRELFHGNACIAVVDMLPWSIPFLASFPLGAIPSTSGKGINVSPTPPNPKRNTHPNKQGWAHETRELIRRHYLPHHGHWFQRWTHDSSRAHACNFSGAIRKEISLRHYLPKEWGHHNKKETQIQNPK